MIWRPLGVICALSKAGIRVPEQCSVIGFDDAANAALYTPALPTPRQPMEGVGTIAVNIVVDGINALLEKREVNVFLKRVAPEPVIMESTRSLV
jgi:DNA-binding LacI/PurR family transcriptional regulator